MMFLFVKQKTAYEMRISDWSSDVCSSDFAFSRSLTRLFTSLNNPISLHSGYSDLVQLAFDQSSPFGQGSCQFTVGSRRFGNFLRQIADRSEELCVGNECVSLCRSWCSPSH